MCKGVIHSRDQTYTTITVCHQDRLGLNGCPRAIPAIAGSNINITIANNGLCPSCEGRVLGVMEAQAIERSMIQVQASSTNGNTSNGGGLVSLPHSFQNEDPDDLFGLLAGDSTTAYQGVSELEGDDETTR
ncbi:hypothetical protein LTS15_004917 [Exophiala xenobiotica]|jgi:hypothetical protein|nr:hypothetical protein LTS15_004917 [Exophiala xenobiotica]